jgi:vacuolar protein sorting-associated protein 35
MGSPFEAIAHEFFTQSLITFEEELTDSKSQLNALTEFVGMLVNVVTLLPENYETLATKCTQHGARLLKKIDQCRAILACSHLFWSGILRDSKRVLECLQRALKVSDIAVQATPSSSVLFVECLNKYIFYFQDGLTEISASHISNLVALCNEHAEFAKSRGNCLEDIGPYLHNTFEYIKAKRQQENSKLSSLKLEGCSETEAATKTDIPTAIPATEDMPSGLSPQSKAAVRELDAPKVEVTRGE